MPDRTITLFLCGDVMTGRGIDQILPHPSEPHLYEPYVRRATEYVRLAEAAAGPIPRRADPDYIWGDALTEFARVRPHARIVNLETAVTASEDAWPHKGIHYRMHPANVSCLRAAGIDCSVLANNHVLDWGYAGLRETLRMLRDAGMQTAGAGHDAAEAAAPAVLEVPGGGRVLVFGFAHPSSGVPPDWAARPDGPGVNYLPDLSTHRVEAIARELRRHRRDGDLVIASVHWGANWGFEIPAEQRAFAHALLDAAEVAVVHGHSSHHVKGIEIHRGRLILYGCGDFLTDYEGISGYEAYRGDLSFMYFPSFDAANGRLQRLELVPTRMRRFRVNRAGPEDVEWLRSTLDREGRTLGTHTRSGPEGRLEIHWAR